MVACDEFGSARFVRASTHPRHPLFLGRDPTNSIVVCCPPPSPRRNLADAFSMKISRVKSRRRRSGLLARTRPADVPKTVARLVDRSWEEIFTTTSRLLPSSLNTTNPFLLQRPHAAACYFAFNPRSILDSNRVRRFHATLIRVSFSLRESVEGSPEKISRSTWSTPRANRRVSQCNAVPSDSVRLDSHVVPGEPLSGTARLVQISTATVAELFRRRASWRFVFRNGEISSLFTSC